MRFRPVLPFIALLLLVPLPAGASSNPIPGVGIVVKRNPGSSSALVIPAGFFGAGSSAFTGSVALEGRCSHDCGGCDNVCASSPDCRLDYAASSVSGPFDLRMPATALYSTSPISVSMNGKVLSLDVVVSLSGQGSPDAAIPGQLSLQGGALDLGSSATVLESSLDLHCTVTFVDRSTGASAGSSLEQDLHLALQEPSLSISRVADGTATGHIVLGQGAGTTSPFTFSSSGGELLLGLLSIASAPSVRASGLQCFAAGAAVVTASPDASHLLVSNLGGTGRDGVDVSLSHLHGHTISSASSCGSLDAGTQFSYEWSCRLNGLPPGEPVIGTLTVARAPDRWTVSCDLSHFSSQSQMRCLAYSGNQLVFDSPCPSSMSLDLLCPSNTLVPAVSYELDNRSRFSVASVSASGSVLLFGGQSVACDRVVWLADCDRDGQLDVCAVRCTAPASSSLHAVDFDSQSIVQFGSSISLFDTDEDCNGLDLHLSPSSSSSSSHVDCSAPLSSRVYGGRCDDGSCLAGGGGGGGGGGAGGSARVLSITMPASKRLDSSSSVSLDRYAPFVLDGSRSTDDGVAFGCRLVGSGTCSPTGEVASLRLQALSGALHLDSHFSSMCADQESVIVLHHGDVVSRLAVAVDGSVTVSAPPGGPSGAPVCYVGPKTPQVSRSNIANNLVAPGTPALSSVVGPDGVAMHMEFLVDRLFCVGGTCVTGDDIVFKGSCSSGACSGGQVITIQGTNFGFSRTSSSWPAGAQLSVLDMPTGASDVIRPVLPASVAISSTRPVVHVPVTFDRLDATSVRGTSVTVQLSPNLVLASPVLQGDYLSRSGQTQMFVVDNGDHSWTVDCALLGGGCGPTGSGTLFELSVARAPGAPDGVGFVTVAACEAADCNAGSVPASPGGGVVIVLDGSTPDAVTGLQATQVVAGNDNDGTTQVALVWSPRSNVSVELYRAPFGNYPYYDNPPNAGSVPSPPAYPPGGAWSPVSLHCSSGSSGVDQCTDDPGSRDFFYYVAFARDAFGNVSPASSMTTGTLDYHLGDVSNGLAVCQGDNLVTASDISLLGAHYGAGVQPGAPFACLDVGPTSTGTVAGRPLTDGKLSFNDLILYAINFSQVSAPANRVRPTAAAANALSLNVPALPEPGATFDVELMLEGEGDLQGVSTQLAWDAAVVEPVSVSSGELLGAQGRQGLVLSAQPGNVDAVLLGAGPGIAGKGTLARATFRVRASGDPAIRVANVFGRDAANRDVAMTSATGAPGFAGHTALRLAFPNPFGSSTNIVFSLAQAGPTEVGVYDVAGRRVRTLVSGVLDAGEHVLAWDGSDAAGNRAGAGVYLLRLEAGGHRETRSLRLVR